MGGAEGTRDEGLLEAASMVLALTSGEMDEKTFAQWFRERT